VTAIPSLAQSSPCWFVGAVVNGRDQTDRFIDEGVWEHGFDDDRIAAQVRSMRLGDRIAIKAAYTQKHGLPFETNGNTASVMKIKATGVVAENPGDGRQIRVHWQRISAPREWFFYTHRRTIWRVLPGEWQDDALIAFTFQNQAQDLNRFRNSPFWRDRFGDASTSPHRFRWASFYLAIADALRTHRHDRQPLIRFLQEAQSRVEGLNLLSGDQFSDGRKAFVADIDPFTLFGLFNRGIRDSNRQAIARELAGFLGVQEPVPQSFEGIPVLNNQKSWYFPYDRDRDPSHIDTLWALFELGLDLADSEDDSILPSFRTAFDGAMQLYGVAWNLSFGLYWCRPWSFLSLDERSRLYLSEKLRLSLSWHGPKNRCSANDLLQLIDTLRQRFEEPDFPVHSFPELSLEAWTYTPSTGTAENVEADEEITTAEESAAQDPEPIEVLPPAAPYGIADILSDGCFHSEERLATMLQRWQDKKNLILQGPPGTGKTWLARRLGKALIGHDAQEPQLRSVQFHPNLSYEDFVRGWRPSGNGALALHDGVVLQMVNAALAAPSQRHVLVIEEINRGNPAQIFGELLTLLEAGKRTPREAMQLCYPDPDGVHRPVHVPENLFVIGTMNIADRSLALVDMAFRRRFAFIDLEPSLGDPWRQWVINRRQMEPTVATAVEQRLEQLNSTITADTRLGKAFRIGHSTVTPSQSLEGRSSRDWFAEVVTTELRPLLHEYWFDAPDVADREADRLLEGW
jgi:5-methylcytosine-specific restriction protein B